MGIAADFARAEAQWLEPDEPTDDPLDRVEHPRERKPWKRDRHAIRWQMQGAINRREAMTVRDFGNGWQFPTSLQYRSWYANHVAHEIRRALWRIDDLSRMHAHARSEHLASLRRGVERVRALRLAA